MGKVIIQVEGLRCERCRHTWVPRRNETPRICPRCKSRLWHIPKHIKKRGRPKKGGQ